MSVNRELHYDDAKFRREEPSPRKLRQEKVWQKETAWSTILNTSWSGELPDGRHWHTGSTCADKNGFDHVVIFGGYSTMVNRGHADVWSLALEDSIWSRISHKNSSSLRVDPRYSHSAVVIDEVRGSISSPGECFVYVFGGTIRSANLEQSDVDQLIRIKFTDLGVQGSTGVPRWDMYIEDITNTPPALGQRASHSAVTYNHRMYIFGGVSGFKESITVHNGLWSYSTRTDTWINKEPKLPSGSLPSGRFNHEAVIYKGSSLGSVVPGTNKVASRDTYRNTVHMIVFGGQSIRASSFTMSSDVWSVMLIDNNGAEVGDVEWRLLIPAKNGIRRADGSALLWNNYIVYFAGLELTSRASYVYRDVFRINIQNLVEADEDAEFEDAPDECLKFPRNNYKVKCIDSQWAQFYDENELRLEKNEDYVLSVPSVRFGFASTNIGDNILLVNGGRFRQELGDTWLLNLSRVKTWTNYETHDYEFYKAATWSDMCKDDIFSCPTLWIFSSLGSCFFAAILSYCICIRRACGNRRSQNVVIPRDANGENIVQGRNQHRRTGVSKERLESLTLTIHSDDQKGSGQDGKNDLQKQFERVHDSCSICMEDYVAGDKKNTLPCNHTFHKQCIVQWLSSNVACPLCRQAITDELQDESGSNAPIAGSARRAVLSSRPYSRARNAVVPIESPVIPSLNDTPTNTDLESVSESKVDNS